jgi:hypothetical protein
MKGKVHIRKGYEGQGEEYMNIYTLSLNSEQEGRSTAKKDIPPTFLYNVQRYIVQEGRWSRNLASFYDTLEYTARRIA